MLFIAVVLLISSFVLAESAPVINKISADPQDQDCVYYFFGRDCENCVQSDDYVQQLEAKYQNLNLQKFEVYYNRDNAALLEQYYSAYNVAESSQGLPVAFISDSYLIGAQPIKDLLEGRIKESNNVACPDLLAKAGVGIVGESSPSNILKTFGFTRVSGSALSNGINKDMLAVILLMLIVLVLSEGDYLKRGIYYISGGFIALFLFGLGLYGAFVFSLFTGLVALVAIFLGLLGTRDYFKGHKPIKLEAKYNVGFLMLGFVAALFSLAHSNQVYFLLRELFVGDLMWKVLPLLIYHSLLVVLPMIAILLLFRFVMMTVENDKEKKDKKMKIFSLIISFVFLLAGLLMLIF